MSGNPWDQRVLPWTSLPDYDDADEIISGIVGFDAERCKRCNICASICPGRAIVDGQRGGDPPALGFVSPDVSACIACGCCLAACPDQAITITRGFRPGLFYQRLSQEPQLTYPRCYQPQDARQGERPMPDASEQSWRQTTRIALGKLRLATNLVAGSGKFLFEEALRGSFGATVKGYLTHDLEDISWAELLEHNAEWAPDKTFLLYEDESFTYAEMDRNANRVAHYLRSQGGGRGRGIGLLLRNSPRFLDVFFATQKIGMYSVPINTELRGAQLAHVIDHSDLEFLLVDPELLPLLQPLEQQLKAKDIQLLINDLEAAATTLLPDDAPLLSQAYARSPEKPNVQYDRDDICLILYTSGTTGVPKGVVYRYHKTKVKMMCLGAQVNLRPSDVYYTAFPLSHGNALLATTTMSMGVKCTVALARKFSASKFWDDIRRFDATVFNTIGSIVPILLKQPQKPTDRQHDVRLVNSAGCPADMWERFERRFDVKLYEIYGAIDGGGKGIFNFGTAPVGSIGKPSPFTKYRIVDDGGNDVPAGVVGELLFEVPSDKSAVEYYKDPGATASKSGDGWLYTGDLVKRDAQGYLYFVGRNTESMRKGGENVSAYEVEQAIMDHPAIEEVAVYAVPSDLAEDEICAAIKLLEGQELAPETLLSFLRDRLARFAVPRYVRFVDAFPKTNSHRIIKGELQREGVTADTFDRETAKPDA